MLKTWIPETLYARIERSRITPIVLLIGAFICLTAVANAVPVGNWMGFDWRIFFRPATLELMAGRTPYSIAGYYNPPWVLLPLIPLTFLPEKLGSACWFAFSWLAFSCAGYKLNAKPIALLALLLSPLVLDCTMTAGMDWVIPFGLLLPPWLGLLFVLAKPQVGMGIALFWLIEAWQMGGFWAVVRRFTLISAAYGLSFLIYGPFLLNGARLIEKSWNISMWPVSMAVAIPLLIIAVRNKRLDLAICSSPFFSPYVNYYSWSVGLLGLVFSPLAMALSSVVLWIGTIIAVLMK